jgi:small conductance mechanosensitive channel
MFDADTLVRFVNEKGPAYALSILSALVIGTIGWVAARWVGGTVQSVSKKSGRIDPTLEPLLVKLARWSIIAITIVAVLDKFGIQTTSLLAFIGAAGLAIGLALKDTVSDLAAGVVLLVLRPFNVGDAVVIAGTGGVVKAIDLFETKLTSWDGVPIVLPNNSVRTAKIENFTRAGSRRIDLVVGIAYGDDIGKAVDALKGMLNLEPRVLAEPESMVAVTELGDSSVDLLVRMWVAPADFWGVKFDMTRAIKETLDGAGVTIPFPQRDVHLFDTGKAA